VYDKVLECVSRRPVPHKVNISFSHNMHNQIDVSILQRRTKQQTLQANSSLAMYEVEKSPCGVVADTTRRRSVIVFDVVFVCISVSKRTLINQFNATVGPVWFSAGYSDVMAIYNYVKIDIDCVTQNRLLDQTRQGNASTWMSINCCTCHISVSPYRFCVDI
jgi:hypothetical protein